MDAYKLSLTGLVLIICSFIFQLIGLASPYWISFEYQEIKVHSGLWKTCATIKLIDKVECFDFESVSGKTAVFIILASSLTCMR